MTLADAYRVLELEPGASEEEIRDARKTLAKVWHPDRHASDPALQAKAEKKLAAINGAFEALRDAAFPPRDEVRAKPGSPYAPGHANAPYVPTPPATEAPHVELVPRRRLRAWVVVALALAVAGGGYVAVAKLGSSDAQVVATRGERPGVGPTRPLLPPATQATFGLGATESEVLAAQGQPTRRDADTWYFGSSTVRFNHRGKVAGWSDDDDVLNAKLVPDDAALAAAAKQRGSLAMGASRDEVIGVLGTPRRIAVENGVETWSFGAQGSSLGFAGLGGITTYHDINHELRIAGDPEP